MTTHFRQFVIGIFILFIGFSLSAQEIPESLVDLTVENALETFNVPGMAVGIVHNGEVVLAKGYGVTDIDKGDKVDSATNFAIASNSKAFTATALMMLQEQGKLNLDDKVKQHIPEFKMYNDYVTEEFTIRDLLTHRSGLGLGAGDLMIWPEGHNFTPDDIIKNIQYLKPVSAFRTQYDYDNLLYVIAGVVIERVSGKSWTEFIADNFLVPLKMDRSGASWNTLEDKSNVISPHVPKDGKLKVINRYTDPILDAAGGIYSNVDDLTNWVRFQLNRGETIDGERLVSEKGIQEIITPQTIVRTTTRPPYNTLFMAYGLGFFLQDVNGKLQVSHTGGLSGIVTEIVMIPQLDLGIIALTNQEEGAAFRSVTNTIKDFYLGLPHKDWVKEYGENIARRKSNADEITAEVWETVEENKDVRSKYSKDLPGNYRDNWLGKVKIEEDGGKLRFTTERSFQLQGDIYYYKDNKFAVQWDNRYLHADAFIILKTDGREVTGFEMKAISPLTDFSFDFHDLEFLKEE